MKISFKAITLLLGLFVIVSTAEAQSYSKWNSFLQKYVTSSGTVNYTEIKKNKTDLNNAIDEINSVTPSSSWSKNQKLAHWMNVYNVYTIKLIIDNFPTSSIQKINGGKAWDKKFIPNGAAKISLNHVENGILRKLGDPRIHFGVNCASISCPKINNKAFTAQNVQVELDKLTKSFINNKKHNIITANKVTVSKIFDWYKADFKASLISFLNKYSTTKINSNAKISYAKYNWNLNGK